MKAASLSDRIAATLQDTASTSAAFPLLISETGAEVVRLVTEVNRLDAEAASPLLNDAAADKARQASADLTHKLRRARAAHSELTRAMNERRELEDNTQRVLAYEEAAAERDLMATEIRSTYSKACDELTRLLARMADSDAKVRAVNEAKPRGADRLRRAEEVARDVALIPDCGVRQEGPEWLLPLHMSLRLPRLHGIEQQRDGYLHGTGHRIG